MTPRARAAILLVGALLGSASGPWLAERLAPPRSLDPAIWTVVTAADGAGFAQSGTTRGARQIGATLVLTPHAFGRVDVVSPRDTRPAARIDVAVAPGGDDLPLQVRAEGGGILPLARLRAEGWRTSPDGALRPYRHAGPVEVTLHDGKAWVDGVAAGPAQPGTVELRPGDGPTTITLLRLYDESGAPFLTFGGEAAPATPASRLGGALVGMLGMALVALAGGRSGRGVAVGALLLVPPGLVLTVTYPEWVKGVERLYLATVEPASLRAVALGAALLPLLGSALLGSGVLTPRRRRRGRIPLPVELGVVLLVTAVASRGLGWPWVGAAVPGLAFVGFPAWNARRTADSPSWALVRDLPALVALAGLGWEKGLLAAVAWRSVCLLADAPRWVHDHARAGTDAALLLLLAAPLGAELAVRASPAGSAWDPAATVAPADPAVPPEPAWEDACGADVIYGLGGSSTGGAFQFAREPGAFWPGRLHARLCAAGEGVRTVNLGGGDRTTWEMARFAPALYAQAAPAVTIVYAGVNDLLGRNSPLTRREAAARAAAVQAPRGLLGVSRLLFGVSLALRPPDGAVENVQAVPLPDAEANLRELAAATTAAGGRLLLVTEYTRGGGEAELRPYWAMERRLAGELPGVRFLDLYEALADVPAREVLADANHHTRAGAERVAGLIEREVRALLAERRGAPEENPLAR